MIVNDSRYLAMKAVNLLLAARSLRTVRTGRTPCDDPPSRFRRRCLALPRAGCQLSRQRANKFRKTYESNQ